jgi:hypothetical protein
VRSSWLNQWVIDHIHDMKNKKGRQGSEEITNADGKERLNRRRFVKGVAVGGVLAFGMGIPSPTTLHADLIRSLIYNMPGGSKKPGPPRTHRPTGPNRPRVKIKS